MFTFNHYNYNVLDLEKSMAFYAAACWELVPASVSLIPLPYVYVVTKES